VILLDVMQRGMTIESDVYINMLKKMWKHFQHVQPDKNLCKKLLQHNNTMTQTSVKTQEAITQLGWLVLPHPSYSPGLAPLDFQLFRLLKDAVHGRKSESDDDVVNTIKTWLRQQDKE
jgi:hypothetical protein